MNSLNVAVVNGRGKAEVAEVHRQRQQGLGQPIISAELNGNRFIFIKDRIAYSKKWKTFHDFLLDYVHAAFGADWRRAEITQLEVDRHPLLIWHQKLINFQKTYILEQGKVRSAKMTGAVMAILRLAYDLYALDHNAELQDRLLTRLRNSESFSGARYETFVAAQFIRAGFQIEFEDEGDRKTTHCEFTATHGKSGKKFSVEAKRREGKRPRVGHLFNNALSKHANHERVIFIDMNLRDDTVGDTIPHFFEHSLKQLRKFEHKLLNGVSRPRAYLFLSNTPWDLYLDETPPLGKALADGFQIPDFKGDGQAESLRAAISAREAHLEMHELGRSFIDHSEVPATFDGENPERVFGAARPQIVIGESYLFDDGREGKRPGKVTTATVDEPSRTSYIGVQFDDGTAYVYESPLSEDEMNIWRRHPDTFFGVVGQRASQADSPLDLYDFFLGSAKKSSKEWLLQQLEGSQDIDQVRSLPQAELASIYAERVTNNAIAIQQGAKK